MSEAYLMTDMFKSLPTASSLSGLSMILSDSSGQLLSLLNYLRPFLADLRAEENTTSLNDRKTLGISMVRSTTQDAPPGAFRGIALTIPYSLGGLATYQIVMTYALAENGAPIPVVLTRVHTSEAQWGAWFKLSLIPY